MTHPSIRASAFAFNILIIHLLGDAISPPLIGKITGLAEGNMNAGFAAVSFMIGVAGMITALWRLRTLPTIPELATSRLDRAS